MADNHKSNLRNNKPVVLITGASSGIGEATALRFGKEGYQVVLAARRLELLKKIAEQITANGGEVCAIQTDITRWGEIQNLLQVTLQHYGRIDVLFNNAGFGRMGWLEELDVENDITAQLKVNLLGTVQMTRAVLPYMIEQRAGHIINMASMAGFIGTPTYTIYAAGKFGVRGFSEALRREVSIHGIHVSVIYPGGVSNEFSQKANIQRKTGVTTPAWLRLSNEDVAEGVLRLARKPRRDLVIPWPMRLFIQVNSFLPGLLDWVMEKYFVMRERET